MAVNIEELKALQKEGLTAGVVAPDGSLRTRLEIDDFVRDDDVTNLFIISLSLLMSEPWTAAHPFSYFQLAGVHGRPHAPWDGVGSSSPTTPSSSSPDTEVLPSETTAGCCCAHGPVPSASSWRRAHLAAFEQALCVKMHDSADRYPEPFRTRYRAAAARFALPYWDPLRARRKVRNVHGHYFYRAGLPVVVTLPTVMVRTPELPAARVPVRNPLYQYNFPVHCTPEHEPQLAWAALNTDGVEFPHTMSHNTIRGITDVGKSDSRFVNASLDQATSHVTGRGVPLGGKLYRVLLGPRQSYVQVSSSAYAPQGKGDGGFNQENSIEGFTNDLHVILGAGPSKSYRGHISLPEYAAFDPVFWLLHANADRLTAIWQALNPDEWFSGPGQQVRGAPFATKADGAWETSTPVWPFMRRASPSSDDEKAEKSHVVPWTSDDLRHVSSLGYTYPELVRCGGDARALTAWVNDALEWTTVCGAPPAAETLLNSPDFGAVEVFPRDMLVDGEASVVPRAVHVEPKGRFVDWLGSAARWCRSRLPFYTKPRYKHIRTLIHGGRIIQWNATVRVEKSAPPRGGSFSLFLFLGTPRADPTTWHQDPNMIGSDGVFAPSSANASAAAAHYCTTTCRSQAPSSAKLLDSDTIPLTAPLVSYWRSGERLGGLAVQSLYPPDVVPFLRANLSWRLLDDHGHPLDPAATASFKIQVGSQAVKLPADPTKKPEYGPERIWPEVTQDKPGGLRKHEHFGHVQN